MSFARWTGDDAFYAYQRLDISGTSLSLRPDGGTVTLPSGGETGPTGPAGPQGIPGIPGPTGPSGSAVLSPNVVLDVWNSTPITVNTPAGGAATVLTAWGGFNVGKTYFISVSGRLSCSGNNTAQMIMYLQPPGVGELLNVAAFPCSTGEYCFNTTVAITIPTAGSSTISLQLMVGGGGGLTTEVITGTIDNAVITQIN